MKFRDTTNYGISASEKSICEPGCVSFFDNGIDFPDSVKWIFPGATPDGSLLPQPTGICYDTAGTYDVVLIKWNGSACDTSVYEAYMTVYPKPPTPVIVQNNDELHCTTPAAYYQWKLNGEAIILATSSVYTATQSGNYSVLITNTDGCQNIDSLYVVFTGTLLAEAVTSLTVFPNPASTYVSLAGTKAGDALYLFNYLGVIARKVEAANETTIIDLAGLPPGTYFILGPGWRQVIEKVE